MIYISPWDSLFLFSLIVYVLFICCSILLIMLPLVRPNIFIIVIYHLFVLLVFCVDPTWALALPLVV